jgi:hypothetical protein
MQSVRLLQQKEGQRQILLASRDYWRLTQLLRSEFNSSNLSLSHKQLENLLEEGANLVGGGLLELIQQNGKPNKGYVSDFSKLSFL